MCYGGVLMLGRTVFYGGALCVMAYCVRVLCAMAVYCVFWRCTLCYGGIMYGMAVYCVLWRCTVCFGGVLCVMAVYCTSWLCTVC